MSNHFGPPSKAPCDVCGGFKNNQIEPRFCYVVCEDHQHISPTNVSEKKHKRKN